MGWESKATTVELGEEARERAAAMAAGRPPEPRPAIEMAAEREEVGIGGVIFGVGIVAVGSLGAEEREAYAWRPREKRSERESKEPQEREGEAMARLAGRFLGRGGVELDEE